MEIELKQIYNNLDLLRISLRKLGPKRRLEEVGLSKIEKAKGIYLAYLDYLELIKTSSSSSKISQEFSEYIAEIICDKIDNVYKKILLYSVSSAPESRKQVKMGEKFDMKLAGSLIPVYDGKDDTIERIIEGIEMMDSILKEADNKNLLISFVLKTRLNNSAKLKLKSKYETVVELIADIKKYLLPKKSANSLLIQLNNINQNNMSIEKYGEKIEELFIGLTIAQADGKPEASQILRPINESLAIKKFADGLRNRRLTRSLRHRVEYIRCRTFLRCGDEITVLNAGAG